ncbi:MAG TPA: hypothetical protein VGM41_20505 [Chitinophagaceae bacterium]|jgi:hypothetical protein
MKLFFKAVRYSFSGYFNLIASIASVIGVLVLLFNDKNAVIIALSSLVLFLVLILLRFFNVTSVFILQKTEHGYHKFATYVRYSTDDGKHIVYELHKYLQCKTVIMDEYVHEFYWSGSCEPAISSLLQEYKQFIKMPKGEYDKAIFKFKKPLNYNEFTVVHVKMDIDDSDRRSQTFCEQSVKELLQLLNFRIELRYLNKHSDARILKRRMNAPLHINYEHVAFAKFDSSSRCYEYTVFTPEAGYAYKIEWDRI